MLVNVEVFVVNTRMKIFDVFEYHRSARVHHQCWGGCTGFNHRASRGQVASEYCNARFILEGFIEGFDHFSVVVLCIRNVLANRLTIGGDGIKVKVLGDFFHNYRQTAGVAKVFH